MEEEALRLSETTAPARRPSSVTGGSLCCRAGRR